MPGLKKDWSRDPAPLGSIRLRRRKRGGKPNTRFIKVRMDGPPAKRWMPLATWSWIQCYGPVPAGKRVVHLDGNTLNDHPDNYGLMTAGEVIKLYHELDPEMSEENRRGEKRRQATSQHNRDRGAVTRATRWLPHCWYAVHHDRRVIVNEPYKSRRLLLLANGVTAARNGRVYGTPDFEPMRGRQLAADPRYLHYTREGNAPIIKHEEQLAEQELSPGELLGGNTDLQRQEATR